LINPLNASVGAAAFKLENSSKYVVVFETGSHATDKTMGSVPVTETGFRTDVEPWPSQFAVNLKPREEGYRVEIHKDYLKEYSIAGIEKAIPTGLEGKIVQGKKFTIGPDVAGKTVTYLGEVYGMGATVALSEDEAVLSIDNKGNYKALKEGTVKIRYVENNVAKDMSVQVVDNDKALELVKPTKLEYIIGTDTAINLAGGSVKDLTANNPTKTSVALSVTNTKPVDTVNFNKPGVYTYVVTVGMFTAEFDITVMKPPVCEELTFGGLPIITMVPKSGNVLTYVNGTFYPIKTEEEKLKWEQETRTIRADAIANRLPNPLETTTKVGLLSWIYDYRNTRTMKYSASYEAIARQRAIEVSLLYKDGSLVRPNGDSTLKNLKAFDGVNTIYSENEIKVILPATSKDPIKDAFASIKKQRTSYISNYLGKDAKDFSMMINPLLASFGVAAFKLEGADKIVVIFEFGSRSTGLKMGKVKYGQAGFRTDVEPWTDQRFSPLASSINAKGFPVEIAKKYFTIKINGIYSAMQPGSEGQLVGGIDYTIPECVTKSLAKHSGDIIGGKFTVPAGSTELHFHALAWKDEAHTITVSGLGENKQFAIVADGGVSGSGSTYTLQTDPSQVGYFSIPLSNIEADTEVTFQAASDKRFVLFGVNAVQPAAITIDPTEWDFGNVKEGASADKVFAVTPNAFVEGALTATFEGADAAKFSAVVDGNNVTVTFTPAEIRADMSATLKVSATNANVTASLTGSGITATTPEIVVPAEPVNFGKVKQDATVSDQQVTVTLNYLDAATASISGSTFSINKTALVAGENTITISANTAVDAGEYSDTITITGTGAEEKQITVNMEVLSKWAEEYDSNVDVGTDVVKFKNDPDNNEYEAIKKGTGTTSQSATITVPKGTKTLHFHAAAWNNENTVLVVKQGNTELGSFDLYKDAGVKSSSPFTLEGNNYATAQYFHVSVAAYTATDEADITFTTTASPYRFVLYGVNQEGGIVPVLDSIKITDEATKTDYEVGEVFSTAGLKVMAYYSLEGVAQNPVPVTKDADIYSTPDTLKSTETTSVTVTAEFEGKSDNKEVAVTVTEPVPTITVSKSAVSFGMVAKDATVEDKTVAVTLKAIASATVELSGDGASAFQVTPASLTEDGDITISATTATIGDFAATITISAAGAESKTVALSISVGANPDVIVASDLAATGTQYIDFSNVVKESGTTYAGNSAKDNSGNIQLRSKDASGIVSTATIGYLKAIDASDVSTATRTLQVYGKNTTYTAASDLYDNATKGKLLGTFTNGGAFVLEEGINLSDYKYIGLRSASGAMQLSSISIAWTPATFYTVDTVQTANGKIVASTDAAAEGETVTLTATPDASYAVASWTGLPEGATVSADKKEVSFTMPAEAVSVSATFEIPLVPARTGLTVGTISGVCLEKEVLTHSGANFYYLSSKAEDGSYIELTEVTGTLHAGYPYIFEATATEVQVGYGQVTADAAKNYNGLYGTFIDTPLGDGYCIILNNKYYRTHDGNNNGCYAHRAYIKLDEVEDQSVAPGEDAPAPSPRRIRLGANGTDVVTGMGAIIFNAEGTKKMVIDNQIVIIRNGKMFNAQGQLVK